MRKDLGMLRGRAGENIWRDAENVRILKVQLTRRWKKRGDVEISEEKRRNENSITLCFDLFYSILFYSILFCSVLFCFILLYSMPCDSAQFW